MSLHLNQQCQRAQKPDAFPNPFLVERSCAWFMVTVVANQMVRRCGGVAYMCGFHTRQTLFAIFLQCSVKPAEVLRFTPP